MSLFLSVLFWSFAVAAIVVSVVIAVYMVLGLVLVQNLRNCDSEYKVLQLQSQFLAEGVNPTISFDLEEYGVSGSPHSSAKQELPSGSRKNVAVARANKQQITSKVYGAALQQPYAHK